MPGFTFGLGDDVASRIHRDLGTDGLFNPDWAQGFAAAGRDGIRSAPLLVVASSAKDNTESWLHAGIFFQRCALEAQRQGLAIAVHAAAVESTGLNAMLRARLKRLARPTMVFRVGYATENRRHSPRLLASSVSAVLGEARER